MTETKELKATIQSIRALTPMVLELNFTCEPPLAFEAGAFVQVGFWPEQLAALRQLAPAHQGMWYFSIASGPEDQTIQLCIRRGEEPLNLWLDQLKEGDSFRLLGPAGQFRFNRTTPQHDVVMIATGTGITPLRSMLRSQAFRELSNIRTHLLFGFLVEEDILYREEWDQDPFQTVYMISEPSETWPEEIGWVTDYLQRNPNAYRWKHSDFYICGHPEMLKNVKTILAKYDVPEESIHHERW